jgi:hypothetical protein
VLRPGASLEGAGAGQGAVRAVDYVVLPLDWIFAEQAQHVPQLHLLRCMRLKHVQLGRALREGKGFSPEDAEVLTERSKGRDVGSLERLCLSQVMYQYVEYLHQLEQVSNELSDPVVYVHYSILAPQPFVTHDGLKPAEDGNVVV